MYLTNESAYALTFAALCGIAAAGAYAAWRVGRWLWTGGAT